MGRIMLATSNNTDEEYGGIYSVKDEGTCTFPTGVTNIGTNLIRENNRIVWLSATVQKSLTLSSWNNLIELPSGYYRNETIRCIAFNTSKGYAVEGEITSGGVFRIYPTSHDSDATAQNITINTMFILE